MFTKSIIRSVAIAVAALVAIVVPGQAGIIESKTDELEPFDKGEGSLDGGSLSEVTSPTRAGGKAFRHYIPTSGKRSELSFSRTKIGETYWLGWSLYFPENFNPERRTNIVSQWASYPSPRNGKFACGGNGHKLTANGNNFEYDLQFQPNECKEFDLGSVPKGEWVDFVQHAKWTGNNDGFLKLWINGKLVLDYKGPTWYNDEGEGLYFKMGAYKGHPGEGADFELFTDEYRLGDANSSMQEVSPGSTSSQQSSSSSSPASSASPTLSEVKVEAENMNLSDYRVDSEDNASGGSLIAIKDASSSPGTASATFSGSPGQYDVYVGYFDEKDGVASMQLSLEGKQIDSWLLDKVPGSFDADKTLIRRQVASKISVANGAKIEIKGTANNQEWARVDYIEFVPAS